MRRCHTASPTLSGGTWAWRLLAGLRRIRRGGRAAGCSHVAVAQAFTAQALSLPLSLAHHRQLRPYKCTFSPDSLHHVLVASRANHRAALAQQQLAAGNHPVSAHTARWRTHHHSSTTCKRPGMTNIPSSSQNQPSCSAQYHCPCRRQARTLQPALPHFPVTVIVCTNLSFPPSTLNS
jgi:hypothetical protein